MGNHHRWKFAVTFFAAVLVLFSLVIGKQRVQAAPVSASGIRGTIKFEGVVPHQPVIDMSKEPTCAAAHKDKPINGERVVIGPGGGLANVVVYISQGLSASAAAMVPSEVATITQKGCQYLPHVLVANVGQHIKVLNSDQTMHNVHPQPMKNTEWNKSQPQAAPPFDVTYASEEVAIPVKCNVHPWMRGYIAVVKGPHAITDDSGSYSLNLPPGNYTITAWQETYGSQTRNVTVAAGKTESANFTFKAN
jgi:plastocyanin